jgi:DNA transposition AAA+ family ATPase
MSTVLELAKKAIEEGNYTIEEVAGQIGYVRSSLSSLLAGKYPASSAKIEAALAKWLRKVGISVLPETRLTYIETRTSQTVLNVCREAQEQGEIAAVIGPPGTGKTEGIRAFERIARTDKISHTIVTANIATSHVSLVRMIAEAMEIRTSKASAATLVERIKERLRREPAVIVIDEAQHLGVRELEVVRAIHDATYCGIVLVGSMALLRTLEVGDHAGQELAQLQNRVAILEKVGTLSAPEVNRFVTEWLGRPVQDHQALSEIRTLSAHEPRRLVRLLANCRRLLPADDEQQHAITLALVKKAGERLIARPTLAEAA